MATHSSILAWRIPMGSGAWQATVHEVAESDRTERQTLSLTCEPASRVPEKAMPCQIPFGLYNNGPHRESGNVFSSFITVR